MTSRTARIFGLSIFVFCIGYLFWAFNYFYGLLSPSNGFDWTDNSPATQKYFIEIQKKTRDNITSKATHAQIKRAWILASNEICSSKAFNISNEKTDWIGRVDKIEAENDRYSLLSYSITIGPENTRIWETIPKNSALFDVLSSLPKEQKVRFSGFFLKGDLTNDNECLDVIGFDDTPEFSGKEVKFKLTKISAI